MANNKTQPSVKKSRSKGKRKDRPTIKSLPVRVQQPSSVLPPIESAALTSNDSSTNGLINGNGAHYNGNGHKVNGGTQKRLLSRPLIFREGVRGAISPIPTCVNLFNAGSAAETSRYGTPLHNARSIIESGRQGRSGGRGGNTSETKASD